MPTPLAKRCFAAFPAVSRGKGEVYFRTGRVTLYAVDRGVLTASVKGSGHTYTVMLDWQNAAQEGALQAFCTCPFYRDGTLCKHLWAVLRKADAQGHSGIIPGEGTLGVKFDEDVLGAAKGAGEEDERDLDLADEPDTWDIAGSGAYDEGERGAAPEGARARPGWEWQVHSILRRRGSPFEGVTAEWLSAERGIRRRRGYYLLDPEQSRRRGALVVAFWHEELRGDGKSVRPRPARVGRRDIPMYPDPVDRELLLVLIGTQEPDPRQLHRDPGNPKWPWATLAPEVQPLVLPRLTASGRFLLLSPLQEMGPTIENDPGPPYRFSLAIVPSGSDFRLDGRFVREGETLPVGGPSLVLPDGTLLVGHRLGRLANPDAFHWIRALREEKEIRIPRAEADQAVAQLMQSSATPPVEIPPELSWEEARPEPTVRAQLRAQEGNARRLRLSILFSYDGQTVPSFSGRARFLDVENRRLIVRDEARERETLAYVRSLGAEDPIASLATQCSFFVEREKFPAVVGGLLARGWPVEAEGKPVRAPAKLKLRVSSGVDWFELDATAEYGATKLSLPQLLAAVKRGESLVELGNGEVGMLPDEWLGRYAPLANLASKEKGKLRYAKNQALLLDAWLGEDGASREEIETDETFRTVSSGMRELATPIPAEAPRGFHGDLRGYQKDGLGWLLALERIGLGGILADDMGLGKTVQCLAFLRALRLRSSGERAPAIAVVPKSIVFNWLEEAERFTPDLKVMSYLGADRRTRLDAIQEHDLVVTTYQTLRRDIDALKALRFDVAILDEAQSIKNAKALTAKACRMIRARFRLAMTGTPIENSVQDLFSILEFVNPGLLGKQFRHALAESPDSPALKPLAKALRPFLLRRTKEMVLKELPEKTEQRLHCPLGTRERKAYEELRDHYRARLAREIEEQGMAKAKFHVLEALLRLRQAACHPGLLDPGRSGERSGKLDALLFHLNEVIREGHKALVFSQFTSFLSIVRGHLDEAGVIYEYLDGQTADRKSPVERFQKPGGPPVFLVSLKAGGLGLNLTAADYVFLLDPWWNPAAESQAIDRAHRIGQTRKVFAYRLIAPDTVEEKILQLQKSKRDLATALVEADAGMLRGLTSEDIQLLLS